MFHEYWAKAGPGGTIPRDMAWRPAHYDKAQLRQLYHEFLRGHYGQHADGEPVYPYDEGNDVVTASTDDTDASIFVAQDDGERAGIAKGAPSASSGKCSPRSKGPKPKQTTTFHNDSLPIFNPNPSADTLMYGNGVNDLNIGKGLSNHEKTRRQAALEDVESVKSESSGTSITYELQNTTPGNAIDNAIDLDSLDVDELQADVDVDSAWFSHPQSPHTPTQENINIEIDQYHHDLEDERLENDLLSMFQNPTMSPDNLSSPLADTQPSPQSSLPPYVGKNISASPLSIGGIRESIEIDDIQEEQYGQCQQRTGSSDDTPVETDYEELQFIREDVKPDIVMGDIINTRTDGLSMDDPIMLD